MVAVVPVVRRLVPVRLPRPDDCLCHQLNVAFIPNGRGPDDPDYLIRRVPCDFSDGHLRPRPESRVDWSDGHRMVENCLGGQDGEVGQEDARWIGAYMTSFNVTYESVDREGQPTLQPSVAVAQVREGQSERLGTEDGVLKRLFSKSLIPLPGRQDGETYAWVRPGITPVGRPAVYPCRLPKWGHRLVSNWLDRVDLIDRPIIVAGHDIQVVGINSPPVATPQGWFILWHAVSLACNEADRIVFRRYRLYAALADDEMRIVAFSPLPLAVPEDIPDDGNGWVAGAVYATNAQYNRGLIRAIVTYRDCQNYLLEVALADLLSAMTGKKGNGPLVASVRSLTEDELV